MIIKPTAVQPLQFHLSHLLNQEMVSLRLYHKGDSPVILLLPLQHCSKTMGLSHYAHLMHTYPTTTSKGYSEVSVSDNSPRSSVLVLLAVMRLGLIVGPTIITSILAILRESNMHAFISLCLDSCEESLDTATWLCCHLETLIVCPPVQSFYTILYNHTWASWTKLTFPLWHCWTP